MMKRIIILLMIMGGSSSPLQSEILLLTGESGRSHDISGYLQMCRFSPGEKIPGNPAKIEKSWKKVKKSGVGLGYSKDTLFFRLVLKNPSPEKTSRLLELNFPTLDRVVLYVPQKDGTYKRAVNGDMVPFSHRQVPDRNPVFFIKAPPGMSEWYISVTSTGSLKFNFFMYTYKSFYRNKAISLTVFWIIYGWLLLMFLVNILVYFQVRENTYLYFVIFLAALFVQMMVIRGFAMQYFWPESPVLNWKAGPLVYIFSIISFYPFIRSYLNMREKYKRENLVLIWFSLVPAAILALLVFLIPVFYSVRLAMLLVAITCSVILVVIIKGSVKGDRAARFLGAGVLLGLIITPISFLSVFGLAMQNVFMLYAPDISLAFFGVFLSLGLGDRINTMKRSLEKKQVKIKEQNEELQATNEELQASNEEYEAQNEELISVLSELEESEKKFRELSDMLPQTVFEINSVGMITYLNQHAFQLMGYTSADVERGINALDMVIPGDRERVLRRMAEMAKGDDVRPSEYTIVKRDGKTFPGLFFTRPVFKDGTLTGYRGIIADLTEQKKNEAMIIQTEKMMTIGGMAAGIAHEINNPLGIIMQGIQNTRRRFDPQMEKNREHARALGLDLAAVKEYMEGRGIAAYLSGIDEAGNRASKIIRNMLSFSRKSSGAREDVDISRLIDGVIELVENDYDLKKKYDFRHIHIVRDYDRQMAPIPIIRIEIEQVFLNIIKNAAQAISENPGENGGPEIRIETRYRDNTVAVVISDNGPGFDEETRKRIFEPFYSTKDSSGTGLGLSVSYYIITGNHGGSISVESEPGRGTSFFIELPAISKDIMQQ